MAWETTWSLAEDRLIVTARANGHNPEKIAKKVCRTIMAVRARLQYHDAYTQAKAARVVRLGTFGQRAGAIAKAEADYAIDPALCPSIVAERDQRYEAATRKTLTAILCGDPEPGRSALDRKQEARR